MTTEWIVIANASQARILQRRRGEGLQLAHTFSHPQGRWRAGELARDKAGRETGASGVGGATYEMHPDARSKERTRFARELGDFIEQAARDGRFGVLAIFAASPFLGDVKHGLGDASARLLGDVHDLDLSHVGMAELPARIAAARASHPVPVR